MLAHDAHLARRAAAGGTSLAAVVGAALVPKCPLCVAAALSALGLGGAIAERLAPMARGLGLGLGAVAALALMWFEWRRRQYRGQTRGGNVESPICCEHYPGKTTPIKRPARTIAKFS